MNAHGNCINPVRFAPVALQLAILLFLATGLAQAQNTPPELFEPGAVVSEVWEEGFVYPRFMDMDGAGNIYVADDGQSVVYTFDGVSWSVFTDGTGSGSGSLSAPFGVVLDAAGKVYVSERRGNTIKRFLPNGAFDAEWGSIGSAVGQFNAPSGLAMDGSGNLYVADKNNDRIQKFDGTDWSIFVNTGLDEPQDVAVDSVGNVYIADKQHNLIWKYDGAGTLVQSWDSSAGAPSNLSFASGVSIDGDGLLHVTHGNEGGSPILVFDTSGSFQYIWGAGTFDRAFDIAFSSGSNAFVSDSYGSVSKVRFGPLLADSLDVTISQFGGSIPFAPLTLNARDAEQDTLTWSLTTLPSSGTAAITGTGDSVAVDYTPDALYFGLDSFVVAVDDGNGGTDSLTVNVAVEKILLTGEPQFLNSTAPGAGGSDYNPQLTTDGAGTWMAIWSSTDSLGDTVGTDTDVFYSVSTDNGLNWSDAAVLNSTAPGGTGDDFAPQLTTDGTGTWIAVWESSDTLGGTINGTYNIVYSVSLNNGTDWSDVAALNSNAATVLASDFAPQLATNGTGTWIAVWESGDDLGGTVGSDRDMMYSISTNRGTSWSPMAALNSNAANSADDDTIQLTTDGAGTWIAVWESTDDLGGTVGGDMDIMYSVSTNNGTSWSPMAALNSNAGDDLTGDYYAQLTTDGAGTWIAVWESFTALGGEDATDRDVHYSVSTDAGGSWSPVVALNSNAASDSGHDQAPQVTTGGNGNWIAVWESIEVGGSDRDIAYSVSTDNGTSWTAIAALASNAATDSGSDDNPQLTTDRAGNWIAAWDSGDDLGGTVDTDDDIFCATLNSAPVIDQDGPLSVTMDEDGVWTAPTLSATDGNGDDLSWTLAAQAGHGTAGVNGTARTTPYYFNYEPNADYNGADSFVIRVSDGALADTITVNVTIVPVNDAPRFNLSGPLDIQMSGDGSPNDWSVPGLSAEDLEGDTVTWSLAVVPLHGTAEVEGTGAAPTTFTYVPDAGFYGMDSLTIEVGDGVSASSIVVNVEVNPAHNVANLNDVARGGSYWDLSPDVATDGSGKWMAVWTTDDDMLNAGQDDADIAMALSVDDGITWTAPAFVNTNATTDVRDDHGPTVVSGGSGVWLVGYTGMQPDVGPQDIMYVCRTLDDGATWDDPVMLTEDFGTQRLTQSGLRLAADRAGNYIAVWQTSMWASENNEDEMDVAFATSSDNGATWTAAAPLDPLAAGNAKGGSNPCLASDEAGTWMAIWPSSNGVLMTVSADNGATWSEPATVNTPEQPNSISANNPVLKSDKAGTWMLAWSSRFDLDSVAGDDSDIFVSTSTDNGATWSGMVLVNADVYNWENQDSRPSIATDGTGNWVVAWYCHNDSFQAISSDDGATWNPPMLLSPIGPSDEEVEVDPMIAAGPQGTFVTVWSFMTTISDIRYARMQLLPGGGKGDINGDGNISLGDAILSLKVACGLNTAGEHIRLDADVNDNNKIGLAEAIYVIGNIVGLR